MVLHYLLVDGLTLIFGKLYPAYLTFKAVKNNDTDEMKSWLLFWIVFAVYSSFELLGDVFLSAWFPFYYDLKMIFVLWLALPSLRGSTYIYYQFVLPILAAEEENIDIFIRNLREHLFYAGTSGVSAAHSVLITSVGTINNNNNADENLGLSSLSTAEVTNTPKPSNKRLSVSSANGDDGTSFVLVSDGEEGESNLSSSQTWGAYAQSFIYAAPKEKVEKDEVPALETDINDVNVATSSGWFPFYSNKSESIVDENAVTKPIGDNLETPKRGWLW